MKDQEYYDYSKDDGKDSFKDPKENTDGEPEVVTLEEQEEETGEESPKTPEEPKKRGCYGCTIMVISIIMIIVGIVVIIVARSTAAEKTTPVQGYGQKTVIVENVDPENHFGVSLKVSLAGNYYYTYTDYVNETRHGRTRKKAVTRQSLVHRVPYTIKAIRESNGEVVYDNYDEFEVGNDEVVKKHNKLLKNHPSLSHQFSKFDFKDKVRFELTFKPDEKYKTQIESGEFGVYKMSSARNITWVIALFVTVLGFLGLFIGFISAIIQYFIAAGKASATNKKSA